MLTHKAISGRKRTHSVLGVPASLWPCLKDPIGFFHRSLSLWVVGSACDDWDSMEIS